MFDERIAIGLPSLAGYHLHDALCKATELGFQSVMSLPDGPRAEHSLGPFPTLGFYGSTEEQKRETAEAFARFRHVAIHQAWDNEWKRWIDCAVCVGAKIVTVHSGRPGEGQSSAEFVAERSEQLRRIADYAGQLGVRVGVENEGGLSADYLGLVASVSSPFVGATLDVGHCAYFQSVLDLRNPSERVDALNATIRTMVRTLGEKLFSLHVHDVRESDWRDHRCVGSGVIDFPGLFTELRRTGYAGLFEVELEEPAREAAAAETGAYLTRLCRSMSAKTGSAEARTGNASTRALTMTTVQGNRTVLPQGAWRTVPNVAGTMKLHELWTGGPVPARADIPLVEGAEFRVIKRYEPQVDGYRFLHGVAIARHRERWFASFGHNRGAENTGGETANCVVSDDDGRTWGPLVPIGAPAGDLAVSHGVFIEHDGALWAFMGAFQGDLYDGGVHTRAYRWNDQAQAWAARGMVAQDGFFPMQEPQRLCTGDWIMAGISVARGPGLFGKCVNPPAVALCHGDNFTKWEVIRIPTAMDIWGESTIIAAGPDVLLISRGAWDGAHKAYVSTSSDFGHTWSELQESNLSMVLSKPYAGILSTGQRYLLSSIHAGVSARQPLCIAVSRPGENAFRKVYRIRDGVHDGPGESHPAAALAYPYAVEHDGRLWVVYSNSGGGQGRTGEGRTLWNNNSAELAIIPIASLRAG